MLAQVESFSSKPASNKTGGTTMKKLLLWLLWLGAIAALLSAVQARTNNAAAQKDTCTTYIYWESPLLK